MNRRILVALSLSLVTVFAIQYFMKKPQPVGPGGKVEAGGVRSGQVYSVPVQQSWHKEPQTEIDFLDSDLEKVEEAIVKVETPLYKTSFSTFGGVLKEMAFKKHIGKDKLPIRTIATDTREFREEGCFLLAFENKTPYIYKMVSHEKKDGFQEVVYETKKGDWVVRKSYRLYDDNYKIDLIFDFVPTKENAAPLSPRLFVPSPYVPEVEKNETNGVTTQDGRTITKISSGNELGSVWGIPAMFGAEDKFFAHLMISDSQNFAQGGFYKRVNKKLFSIIEGAELKKEKSFNLSFYIGPKLLQNLSAVDERLEGLLSFGWLSWFARLLLKLLEFLYRHIGNFGIAIIILTILLKLPFVPLSISSRRKMEQYQKFQPTINRIRAKYKNDLKTQQEEIMRFHKEHNLSPATPMIGCLPMLIQLPILFALYRVLNNYLSLYQAPLFLWIQDLSSRDPYYVLPILMGLTMFWQQRLSPVTDSKQRVMMMFMPIVVTAVFINFPAGLVLYWFTNNLLTVGEDLLRKKVL